MTGAGSKLPTVGRYLAFAPWREHAALLACTLSCACSGFGGAGDQLLSAPATEEEVLSAMGAAGSMAATAGAADNPAAADWSCLGAAPAAPPAITGTGQVRYSVGLRSMLGLPITDLLVRACAPADLECASPLSEVRGLNPEGRLEVAVPVGFAGFLEIEPEGHARSVLHMRQAVFHDTVDLEPILAIPAAAVAQLAGLLNIELIPDLSLMLVSVVDCRGQRAPGVTLANNVGGKEFYLANGLPNVMVDTTDFEGLGGFVNVPLRLVEVSATVEADGRAIGSRSILPRAGWIMGLNIRPPALPLE